MVEKYVLTRIDEGKREINHIRLKCSLSLIDYHEVFTNAIDVNDFVSAFESRLADCIALSSRRREKRKRKHGARDLLNASQACPQKAPCIIAG